MSTRCLKSSESELDLLMKVVTVLNVVNYKRETNALAYTFKAGSWQI